MGSVTSGLPAAWDPRQRNTRFCKKYPPDTFNNERESLRAAKSLPPT
jgi:hypothetical protein